MCYKRLVNPCQSQSFLLPSAPFHFLVWFDTGFTCACPVLIKRNEKVFTCRLNPNQQFQCSQISSKTILWLSSHSLASILAVPHIHFLSSPMLSQSPHLIGRSQDVEGQHLLVGDGLVYPPTGKWSCRV